MPTYPCQCRICGDFIGNLTNEAYRAMDGLCNKEECLEHVTPWNGDTHYQAQYAYASGYRD